MASADTAKTQQLLKEVLRKMQPEAIKSQPRDRLDLLMNGKISFAEFLGVTSDELLEIAMHAYNLYKQGRYKEAKGIYESLCELDATEPFFFRSLGTTLLAMGDVEGARTNLDEALRLNAQDPDALVQRSEVLLQAGQPVQAVQDLQAAIQLDPEGKEPATQRAKAIAQGLLEMMEQQRLEAEAAQAEAGGNAKPASPAAAAKHPVSAKPAAAAKPAAKTKK